MQPNLKRVPYGLASFETLRQMGFAHVDKTHYIQVLENAGTRCPLIIRPFGFGKSLFADMLMAYYDKAAAQDFAPTFAGTWINENPTPFASRYLVLKFDFSGIDGTDETLATNFMLKVKDGMWHFVKRYFAGNARIAAILDKTHSEPAALLIEFLTVVRNLTNDQIYLIIDEYDQFAQNVLTNNPTQLRAMIVQDGFIKNFYAVIKDFAQTLIARTFITGVTSMSLDSMTSGFNIARNVSNHAEFSGAMGFTEDELRALIPQIVDTHGDERTIEHIFERMNVLYGGYRFSPESDITILNPSLCLDYLSKITRRKKAPADLLGSSFAINLSKLEGILALGQRNFVDEVVLNVLFDRPVSMGALSNTINLNPTTELSSDDILSALVFMGFLTFSKEAPDHLVCPNLAIKEVFSKYWLHRTRKFDGLAFLSNAK